MLYKYIDLTVEAYEQNFEISFFWRGAGEGDLPEFNY